LNLEASWVDQDKSLLEHISKYLASNGVASHLSETWTEGRKYFELSVVESGNLLELLKQMLPYLDKKYSQIEAGIEYLQNKITADEFIEAMNQAVREGKRSSSIRAVNIPYTKELGLRLAQASKRWRKRSLTRRQVEAMRRDREELGMSYGVLSVKYGVPPSTAHFALTRYRLEGDLSS